MMAYAEDVASHRPFLRAFARRLYAPEPDDLAHDTICRALSRCELYRAEDLRGWLGTMLYRLALNERRAIARRPEHVDVDDMEIASPASQLLTVEASEVLTRLKDLRPEYRAVVRLVCIDGMSYSEAASELGVPIGTLMSRLSRARARLVGRA